MSRFTCLLILVGVFLLIYSPANALLIQIDTRASFDAMFPGSTIENWDSFSDDYAITKGSTVNGITYDYTLTSRDTENYALIVTNVWSGTSSPNSLGSAFTADPQNEWLYRDDIITFTFDEPKIAFGIEVGALSPAGFLMATTSEDETVQSTYDPFPGTLDGNFIGFLTDQPFTSVTIGPGSGPAGFIETYYLDTMRAVPVGVAPVPEPSTLLLLGSGLVGLVGFRRKLKK